MAGPHFGIETKATAVQVVDAVVVQVQLVRLSVDLKLSCLDSVGVSSS
jgi:hypothetical protein